MHISLCNNSNLKQWGALMKTIFLVVPFIGQKQSKNVKASIRPTAEPAFQCYSRNDAENRARRVAERDKYVGAIAVVQKYDKDSDELGKYEEIARFGMVPQAMMLE